jgi:hypothetical protein
VSYDVAEDSPIQVTYQYVSEREEVLARLAVLGVPPKRERGRIVGTWKWINYQGIRYYDIGISLDSTLHNPNGYPEETVRAAISLARESRRVRRSEAAVKAAETRRRRTELLITKLAKEWTEGNRFGPRDSCLVCKKKVSDDQSVARGIGSDCWQRMLAAMEELAAQRRYKQAMEKES